NQEYPLVMVRTSPCAPDHWSNRASTPMKPSTAQARCWYVRRIKSTRTLAPAYPTGAVKGCARIVTSFYAANYGCGSTQQPVHSRDTINFVPKCQQRVNSSSRAAVFARLVAPSVQGDYNGRVTPSSNS